MDDEKEMNNDDIFFHVKTLLDRLYENRELQKLAENNGLEIKNSVKLTDDTINNIAVSTIGLLLAKREKDPNYTKLVRMGIQKRSLKTEIINTYKNQANQLIIQYKKKSSD